MHINYGAEGYSSRRFVKMLAERCTTLQNLQNQMCAAFLQQLGETGSFIIRDRPNIEFRFCFPPKIRVSQIRFWRKYCWRFALTEIRPKLYFKNLIYSFGNFLHYSSIWAISAQRILFIAMTSIVWIY